MCDVIWKEKHANAEVIIVFYQEHLDSGKLFYKCLLMLLLCPFLLVLFELGSVRSLLLYGYRGHGLKHVIKKSYIWVVRVAVGSHGAGQPLKDLET